MKIILGGNVGKLILKHSPGNNFEVFLQQQVEIKPSSRARFQKNQPSSIVILKCPKSEEFNKGRQETI